MSRSTEDRRYTLALLALPLCGAVACATRPVPTVVPHPAHSDAVAAKRDLPIRKIRFYESGIAQFERTGRLRDASTLLPLPVSDIDDVLQTLTIRRGPNLVPDYSATFETVILTQAARIDANLPAESRPGLEYEDFVQSLKGERIEFSVAGRSIRGRLVELVLLESDSTKPPPNPPTAAKRAVTSKTKIDGKKVTPKVTLPPWREFEITVLTDRGAIERYPSSKVAGLRARDPAVAARLEAAAAAMSGRTYEASRLVRIRGQAGEAVDVTYVTQVPLPRVTYRLHAGSSGHLDTLKGFALFHNDTDEAWDSVAIELTNDELDSNVVPFATPRYWDRPVRVTRDGEAPVVAQLRKQNADSLAEATTNVRATQARPSSPPAPAVSRLRAPGNPNLPKLPQDNQRATVPGHLSYAYSVNTAATLPAHASALLPFIETPIKTERGVWFGPNSKVGRAVVRIQNTLPRPLPAGMLSIFDAERFAGETELTQLEPGRYGYFDYATALGLELKQKALLDPVRTCRSVSWSNDAIQSRWSEQLSRTVELTNASNQAMTAYVFVSAPDGAVVKGVDAVDTDFTGRPIAAIVKVPAAAHVERTITIDQEQSETDDADNLDVDSLTLMAQQTTLAAGTRAILTEAIRLVKAKQATVAKKEQLDQRISQLEETISRLPVSDTSHPVPGPIAARFLQLEAERTQMQKQGSALETSAEQQSELIKKVLGKLPTK